MKDTSGSAFPTTPENFVDGYGLSKREWFAGMASIGLLARKERIDNEVTGSTYQEISIFSYRLADAMLAAGKDSHEKEG